MEIKYRCWDKLRKTFVYWDDLAISPVTPEENYKDGATWESDKNGELSCELEPNYNLTFQLWSGLFDRGGVEIYEGDYIITELKVCGGKDLELEKDLCEVQFRKGSFIAVLQDGSYRDIQDCFFASTVAGNIFQTESVTI